MSFNKFFCAFLLILLGICDGVSQADLGSWTSLSMNMKFSDKITMKARPIVRHKSDISEYNNSSIDISWHYKINNSWSAMILERHFFIPDSPDREFIFFDLTHKGKLSDKINLSNRVRYHLGLNFNGVDPDFIRYQPTLTFNTDKKLKPFVAIDIWYRLSEPSSIAGSRYIAGINYPLSKKLSLNTQVWRQDGYKVAPLFETYLVVITFNYNLNYFYPKSPDTQIGK